MSSVESVKKHGYHISQITKGVVGELSKIYEEVEEIRDAEIQNCKLMILIELSDLVGAVEMYLNKYFTGVSLHDLIAMSNITKRAFDNGIRK